MTRTSIHSALRHQAGFSLLELLIAMALGLLLVVGIGTIFIGSNQTYRVQEQNARLQESGRFALEIVGRSLRQAGYRSIQHGATLLNTNFPGVAITGNDGAGNAADSITIQFDGDVGDQDCEGNNVTPAMVAAATPVQNAIRLNALDLECDGNVVAGAQPLISNVEDLQVLYGIDTDGNQSADQYIATPADWDQVVSARVCVLIRSEEQGISAVAQNFLNCAGALGTAAGNAAFTAAGDSRLRRAFVGTFNLRNRIRILP